jgi:hypothetical protein
LIKTACNKSTSNGGGLPVGGRRVNRGDESEGIWLMGFTYMYEIKQ